ncbi:MAG: hypothetical protein JXR07_13305 [Reichenbachiella sp.]
MYTYLLYTHSWVRWIILILAIINIYNSYRGWKGLRAYNQIDDKLSTGFVSAVHLQATLGLTLYFFLSPFAFSAILNDAPIMENDTFRFWSIEHIFAMVTAVTSITIGRVKSKKETEDKNKFKKQLVYYSIGLILILSAIPFQEVGRLFRF